MIGNRFEIEIYFRKCSECNRVIGVLADRAKQIDEGEMTIICTDHNYHNPNEEDLPLEAYDG